MQNGINFNSIGQREKREKVDLVLVSGVYSRSESPSTVAGLLELKRGRVEGIVWRSRLACIAAPVLSPGGEGSHSLASPALAVDEALRREVRKLKESGFGGGSAGLSSGVTRVSVAGSGGFSKR
ncbi:hypothetical protein YC2023_111323 [Brassica napus]